MNRATAKRLAPIIKEFGDGKDVQYTADNDDGWTGAGDDPSFHPIYRWRVKPEPRVFWFNPSDRSQSPRTGCWMTQEEYDQEEYETDKFSTKGYIKVIEVLEDD